MIFCLYDCFLHCMLKYLQWFMIWCSSHLSQFLHLITNWTSLCHLNAGCSHHILGHRLRQSKVCWTLTPRCIYIDISMSRSAQGHMTIHLLDPGLLAWGRSQVHCSPTWLRRVWFGFTSERDLTCNYAARCALQVTSAYRKDNNATIENVGQHTDKSWKCLAALFCVGPAGRVNTEEVSQNCDTELCRHDNVLVNPTGIQVHPLLQTCCAICFGQINLWRADNSSARGNCHALYGHVRYNVFWAWEVTTETTWLVKSSAYTTSNIGVLVVLCA